MSKDLPDFDILKVMAEKEPEKLEALRQEMVEDLIESAPTQYQRRLRGLQFQIDMERRRAKTPMAACVKISSMMHDSLTKLRDNLAGPDSINSILFDTVFEEEEVAEAEAKSASLLKFPC